jgi:hypothetical protein
MKQLIIFLFAILLLPISSDAQFDKLKKQLKGALAGDNSEVAGGLKEALEVGVSKGTDFLSAKDGFYKSAYKILIPNEAQQVINKVKSIPGFGNVEEELIEKMNRAAELAAAKAKPIFVKAITDMTIGDAMNILMGEQNAATTYLNKTTNQSLYNEFRPVIVASLNEVNAIEYWASVVNAYNRIPLVKKVNPALDDYVTNEALKALFNLIEKEEKNIRTNIGARSSELLKRVFAQQDRRN